MLTKTLKCPTFYHHQAKFTSFPDAATFEQRTAVRMATLRRLYAVVAAEYLAAKGTELPKSTVFSFPGMY